MEGNISRDENMKLSQFINKSSTVDSQDVGAVEPKKNPLADLIHSSESEDVEVVHKEPETHMTELEKSMKMKKEHQRGIVGDVEEEQGELRSIRDTDENREGFKEAVKDQNVMIEKARKVVLKKRPESGVERIELMDELNAVEIGEDGIAIVPEGSKYLIARTPEIEEQIARIKAGEVQETEAVYEDPESYVKQGIKEKIVNIVIDKTGLGANFDFTDDENKIIRESEVIHLIEVEDKEIRTIDFEKADESLPFLQTIETYQLSSSNTPMTFVGSGFKADMCGLSWGEYSDITLDISDESTDYLDFDKMNMKLSVIYNKMINISIGKFKNYEDFLRNFAYIDMQAATYGLVISTQPEIDEITLKCNMKTCNKRFPFKYSPRTLIDFSEANTYYLKRLEEINNLKPEDRLKYALNSPVRRVKRVQLPTSKYLVDLSLISCYDYLYKLIPYVNELNAQEEDPELKIKNEKKWKLVPLLNVVSGIHIPQKSGGYVKYTKFDHMIDIMNGTIPPSDMMILNNAYYKFLAQFYVGFSLKNIECPHCGKKTKAIEINPDQLVFLINQHQNSTQIKFDNFLEF